jgi:hypothetical protein
MIRIALTFLKNYLKGIPSNPHGNATLFAGVEIVNSYLPSKTNDPDEGGNKIYITLLNIEEERTSKTPYRYEKVGAENPVKFKLLNPELTLNLYVMVSGTGSYNEALKNISKVVTVFANKNAFKLADIDVQLESPDDKGKIEELWLDIQNISLDQSNNLWQALANNILPHIIYKIRTIAIIPDLAIGGAIETRTLELEVQHK